MDTPSTSAQVIITIIPIVGIVLGATVIFFYLLYSHKQKMFMIEKGLIKKINFDLDLFSLFAGLLLFFIGLCLTIFFEIKEGLSYGLLSGIIPLSCGFSLLIYYIIRLILKKDDTKR